MKNLFKKLAIAAMSLTMVFGVTAMSACNTKTDHPTVQITVEFNNQTYDLSYTLYRNMFPNTVQHFITLADEGYYNNMLVHDYRTSDWVTGGYGYDAADYAEKAENNAYTDYFQDHSKESEYMSLFNAGKLHTNVYSYANPDVMLPTIVGEFDKNKAPSIQNGAPSADTGALKMIYYAKQTTEKVYAYFNDGVQYSRDYKYNCATSLFAIQVNNGTSYAAADYCVFGRIVNIDALSDLKTAVSDYIGGATVSVENISVDNAVETYSPKDEDKGISVSFTLPSTPIVIKYVKVTKY